MSRRSNRRGQALVESALALLLAAVVLAASFRAALAVLQRGVSESVALQEAIRHGRRLPPPGDRVRRAVFGDAPAACVRRRTGDTPAAGVPVPLRLAGRSEATVALRWPDAATHVPGEEKEVVPEGTGRAILTCDPWDAPSPSGKRVAGAVRLLVATGWLR